MIFFFIDFLFFEEFKISFDWYIFYFYENSYLSGLYGVLGGLLVGGVFLGIFWYFYGIEFFFFMYIVGSMVFLLLIGMSFFVVCRCIICILVFEFLGKYGRWVFYFFFLVVLVSGLVFNIFINMERMFNSMSCSVEMIKN